MAEFIQLDAAAKLVGKSEVTLRRLVKAGKVAAHKEKTLTGFIYRVDADQIRAYYNHREAAVASVTDLVESTETEPAVEVPIKEAPQPKEKGGEALPSNGRMRVAVSNDKGSPAEYWLKRAELYEEKYLHEIRHNAQLREELGLWRGRAEHAQGMLMKMLPIPGQLEVSNEMGFEEERPAKDWVGGLISFIAILVLVGVAAATYVFLKR
jgi:hypothetical protein